MHFTWISAWLPQLCDRLRHHQAILAAPTDVGARDRAQSTRIMMAVLVVHVDMTLA
jgi:hypothetical protein